MMMEKYSARNARNTTRKRTDIAVKTMYMDIYSTRVEKKEKRERDRVIMEKNSLLRRRRHMS